MNATINSLQQRPTIVKRPHDRYNLARSRGEYAPKWTRKSLKQISRRDNRIEAAQIAADAQAASEGLPDFFLA